MILIFCPLLGEGGGVLFCEYFGSFEEVREKGFSEGDIAGGRCRIFNCEMDHSS